MDSHLEDKCATIENSMRLNHQNLVFNLLKLGVKLGVFTQSLGGDGTIQIPVVPNLEFLNSYIDVSLKLGLIKMEKGSYTRGSLHVHFNQEDFNKIIPELFVMYDHIAAMAPYKAISGIHPNILMSFEKDGDVWDLFLENPFCQAYREVVNLIGGLRKGDKVLDVGCGSVSPLYFAHLVGPSGSYTGVEKSSSLSRIGNNRLKREKLDWAEVKNLDFQDVPVTHKYDYVICTNTLNYMGNIKKGVNNMLSILSSKGKLVIFDVFPDLLDFSTRGYEFYNSLTTSFSCYTSSDILSSIISRLDDTFSISIIGSNFMLVEK